MNVYQYFLHLLSDLYEIRYQKSARNDIPR